MRWRSLLLVALLILGGGTAGWFVLRHARARAALEAAQDSLAQPAEAPQPLDAPNPEPSAQGPAPARAPVEDAPGVHARNGRVALRGRVVDESDAPVRAYDLELVRRGFLFDDRKRSHVEAADGCFAVEALASGTWEIWVSAPGLVMVEPGFSVKLPHEDVLVRLRHVACVSGIVLDPAGTHVPDLHVYATRILGGAPAGATNNTSDEEGRFRFDDLEPGTYAFETRDEPCDPVLRTVGLGVDPVPIVLQLRSGGIIEGEVAAEYVESFRESGVACITADNLGDARSAKLDRNGRFRVEHARAGRWLVLLHAGSPAAAGPLGLSAECTVQDGETSHVILGARTADSVRVSGRVLCRGAPVPGVEVAAFLDGAPPMRSAKLVRADSEGRYQVVLDACGPVTFLLSKHEVDFGAQYVRRVIPRVREHTLDLQLSAGGVRGVVVDEAGKPLPKVHVWLMPVESSRLFLQARSGRDEASDESGRFAFEDLAPGSYLLLAGGGPWRDSDGSAARARLPVAVGSDQIVDEVVLRLAREMALIGVVRDSAGQPCAGLEVYALLGSGELLQPSPVCRTGRQGEFACEGLAPGRYVLFARGEQDGLTGRRALATQPSRPIDAHAGGPAGSGLDLELVAYPATVLRVDVRDADGNPTAAELRLLDELGREVGGVIGAADLDVALLEGAFAHRTRFGPLPPGSYTLEARTGDGHAATQIFATAGEPERKLTVRVE